MSGRSGQAGPHHTCPCDGRCTGRRSGRRGPLREASYSGSRPRIWRRQCSTGRGGKYEADTSSTRERKTYAIKSFFRFIHHHGVIATNVALKLIPPRPKRPEPRFLSEEEYQRLLRVCSHDPRDAAIVEVLLQTGMRLSELARLTVHDVELPRRINREPDNTGSVRIRRKGGKEATIPLNRFARLARRWRRG